MSKSPENARLQMQKADEDFFVLQRLSGDPETPVAVIGFHAQQAVEKCLKAVLTSREIPYPRTHDIAGLLKLLAKNGLAEVPQAAQLPALTPFAAEFRYGRLPPEQEAQEPWLDAAAVMDYVRRVRAWTEAILRQGGPSK
jgi:HEPN domain-containing protein